MNVWRSVSPSRQWHDHATSTHIPSVTFDTCWRRTLHRHWRAVWSCPGSITATLCSTALQRTPSGSCSVCRRTLLGSSSRRKDDPTPRRCWTRCTGCPFSRELTTRWLCWLLRSAARRRRHTSIVYSRTETSTICDDDRPLRRCADRSQRQQSQSVYSAAQHQPSGTRSQRQFWTVTL